MDKERRELFPDQRHSQIAFVVLPQQQVHCAHVCDHISAEMLKYNTHTHTHILYTHSHTHTHTDTHVFPLSCLHKHVFSSTMFVLLYPRSRRQFGPKDKDEVKIIEHQTQYVRLMPHLAAALALTFTTR